MIHARFYLTALTLRTFPHAGAEFSAVCRGEHNQEWAKATPVGTLTLGSLDPAEIDWFIAQRADVRDGTYGCEFDLYLTRGDQPDAPLVRPVLLVGIENDTTGNGNGVKFVSLPRAAYVEWTMRLGDNEAWRRIRDAYTSDHTDWWLAMRRD